MDPPVSSPTFIGALHLPRTGQPFRCGYGKLVGPQRRVDRRIHHRKREEVRIAACGLSHPLCRLTMRGSSG
ncbi:MAG: hypothetical protein QXZ31_09725 [Thermofilaceae archaeon]